MSSRILLLIPIFYGVEKEIKSVLEESGYDVVWVENKTLTFDYHATNSKLKFLRRIYSFLFFPHKRYIKQELKKIENTRFDILFAINGHAICKYLFKRLNRKNPQLFSVLYLWDSFTMYSWEKEINYFTKVYTFEPADSLKHPIEYKPLFYIKKIGGLDQELKYDLFLAGRFNSQRFFFIDKLLNQLDDTHTKYFVRLWPSYKILFHNHLIYTVLKKLNFKSEWFVKYQNNFEAIEGSLKKDYILNDKINYREMQNQVMSSNVILNLPFKSQTGYSYGLIEALAHGKKIITTNSNIKEEKFFNPEQIHIINLDNPVVDYVWIKEEKRFPVDKLLFDLELSKWLKSILSVEIA